jgi:hypothetical protein
VVSWEPFLVLFSVQEQLMLIYTWQNLYFRRMGDMEW